MQIKEGGTLLGNAMWEETALANLVRNVNHTTSLYFTAMLKKAFFLYAQINICSKITFNLAVEST